MALNSAIEWTHHTANLWWGCTKVHEGCDNCYAETWANRYGVAWGNDALRKEVKSVWGAFLGMQAKAKAANEIHRVFVGSMMDIFEKPMATVTHAGESTGQTTDVLRSRFFEEIVPNCPNLMFLLLTKRPSNINKIIPISWIHNQPHNVAYGASVVNESTAFDVQRHFQKVNGKKFFSVEPQLDFIDFSKPGMLDGIQWLIQGGESGARKRPFNTDWARHTAQVCQGLGVAYFFKQVDKVQPVPDDLMIRQFAF